MRLKIPKKSTQLFSKQEIRNYTGTKYTKKKKKRKKCNQIQLNNGSLKKKKNRKLKRWFLYKK